MQSLNVVYSVASWLPLTMKWIYTQIKYLDNFTPLILTNTIADHEQYTQYPIFSIDQSGQRKIFEYLRKAGIRAIPPVYAKAINQYRPIVLHSHFGDWGWYDLPMAKRYSLKQVVTFYGYDISKLPVSHPKWILRYRELFDHAHLFLCEGPYMAQTLVTLGCPQDKVRVQHLGVDVDTIPFLPRQPGENGEVRILIAGRFTEKKGIPYALEAIGRIKESFPKIRVTVFGDSTRIRGDEDEKNKIMNIIQRFHMEPITKFKGFQPFDVLLKEMFNHHLFLSPSVKAHDGDTEGGAPVTIIEALASGMPVISTSHCDIPSVVTHNVSGLLSNERDTDGITNSLERLLTKPELWIPMAKAGRKHIEAEYNARIQGQKLKEVYEKIENE